MPEPRPGDLVTYQTMQRYVADTLAEEMRAMLAELAKTPNLMRTGAEQ